MKYTIIKSTFDDIMGQAENEPYINVQGIKYPRHETFNGFRKILKEFKKKGGSIETFKQYLENDYFPKAKDGVLSDVKVEFLHDVMDLLMGNCPYQLSLDYDESSGGDRPK